MKCLGRRVPRVQVSEDPFDDIGVVDERDDAHRGAAVGTLERIDLVNFLNQSGPAGFVPGVDRPFIGDDGGRTAELASVERKHTGGVVPGASTLSSNHSP